MGEAGRRQLDVGDELFEARCVQQRGVRRAHGTMALRDGVVDAEWQPAGGYVEARTASVWARRFADGDYEVLTCTWRSRVGAGGERVRWLLTTGRVSASTAEGRHGVLRFPSTLHLHAREWTLKVDEIAREHAAVAYAWAVAGAEERVLQELTSLLVPSSTCWAGWVRRRTPGAGVFDFHFMLADERTELRRRQTRDGFAAAIRRGRVVTELRCCLGCSDPTGEDLPAALKRIPHPEGMGRVGRGSADD